MRRTDADHAREALEHLAVIDSHVAEGGWGRQVVVDAVCLRLAASIDAASSDIGEYAEALRRVVADGR